MRIGYRRMPRPLSDGWSRLDRRTPGDAMRSVLPPHPPARRVRWLQSENLKREVKIMTHKASIGRIVHYYQGDYEAPVGYSDDQKAGWRGTNSTRNHPAIITCVHTDDCVNLIVFFDGTGSKVMTSMTRLPDEVFVPGMHCTNSGWRWPE